MRTCVKNYIQQFEKTLSFTGISWWIIDFEEDPSHFRCNREMEKAFSLDPSLDKHSVALTCPIAGDYNAKIGDEQLRQQILGDYQKLFTEETDEYCNQFPFTCESTGTTQYYRSRALVLERNLSGAPSVIYGFLEEVTDEVAHLKQLQEVTLQRETLLNKQKELFAIVGHELRTPVATIDMLIADSAIDDSDKLLQIKDVAQNLLHVLEDLRFVVAPERAMESKPDQGDPVYIVERTLSPLKRLISDSKMELHARFLQPKGREFSIYSPMLRQVVTNLVKNAAVHSGGSQIYVMLGYEKQPDGSLFATLRVEDDGKGIPEDRCEDMFEAFSRGDTSKDGSGLGLHIARELAQKMGGDLTYCRSQYGGACFCMNFSLEEIKDAASAEPDKSKLLSLSGLRILLAEDDLTLRMLTERALGNQGAVVTSYENGALALEAFSPEKYDLVLTDLVMPVMNGHELTRAIRASGCTTPIIAVTAAVIGDETEQFIAEGANAVIAKPITTARLIEALEPIIPDQVA